MTDDYQSTARLLCSIARAQLESRCATLHESLKLELAGIITSAVDESIKREAAAILEESRQ